MVQCLRYAALLSLAFPSLAAGQAPPLIDPGASRLAYFSVQRAFSASTEGKASQAKLSALEEETAREIESRNRTLRMQQEALQRGALVPGEAARRVREQEVEKLQIDVQRFIQDAQAALMGVQRDIESAFLAKLRPALDQVAKDKGLLLVINEDGGLIAWADPSLDITPDVVTRLNQP